MGTKMESEDKQESGTRVDHGWARQKTEQCNETDGLSTEEDASEADGRCSSSLRTQKDGPLLLLEGHQLLHFAESASVHSFCEVPSSSLLLMSEEEEAEQEQKQQQLHQQPIILEKQEPKQQQQQKPSVSLPRETAEKPSGPLKRQRRNHLAQFVEMPTVAEPWGTTAPERLGIRRSKVIMLGDSGVGKTSIVFSYKFGPNPALLTSPPCNATIGASYTNFNMSVFDGVNVQLQIWDTAGQERFRCMVPLYMRNASAAILVYDITNRDSFEQIEQWHNEVMRCPTAVDEPVIVLIGNKADQQGESRTVAEGEGVQKALRLNAHFFEVSAVDSEVIRSIFKLVAEKILLQCANVENASEADEAMFAEGQNGRTAEGQKTDDRSPVIRLDTEDSTDWAQQLMISCRNLRRWAYKMRTGDAAPMSLMRTAGGNCCSAL